MYDTLIDPRWKKPSNPKLEKRLRKLLNEYKALISDPQRFNRKFITISRIEVGNAAEQRSMDTIHNSANYIIYNVPINPMVKSVDEMVYVLLHPEMQTAATTWISAIELAKVENLIIS